MEYIKWVASSKTTIEGMYVDECQVNYKSDENTRMNEKECWSRKKDSGS